jgi:4a-hydroxytetrahydrobiopterin dehydratase
LKKTPTALTAFDKMPNNYLIDKEESSAIAEYKFGDFKEAFCYLNLIAQTCSQFDYHPEIFNVYNRITVKLYTKNEI